MDDFKSKNKSSKLRINSSFEPGQIGDVKSVSIQFSFTHNNKIYLFHSDIFLGRENEDEKVSEELKRSSILFNIIRSWIESLNIETVAVRIGQRVNGVVNFPEFYNKTEELYNKEKEATFEPLQEKEEIPITSNMLSPSQLAQKIISK
jgi:hypothetical protein